MNKIFLKAAARFYKDNIGALLRSLLPRTSYQTHFVEHFGYQEFLDITTTWMGQTLRSETYELKHRPEREAFLKDLHKQGHLSDGELEKYLHN